MKQQKRIKWTRLDNASKLFPATSNNKDTKVFRLACELYEAVNPEILQQSLNLTIENFPLYKSVLRRGAFWYYFESSDIEPIVKIESNPVCAPIYIKDSKNLLFRVFYYNKRINLEIFHALSDGAGAVWFMETLVYYYLTLKYKELLEGKISKLNYKASISQKMDDSFGRRYHKGENSKQKSKDNNDIKYPKAYHMRGTRIDEYRTKLVEGSMSVKAVLNQAHEYNTTLTVFMTSVFIYSIYKEMPAKMNNHPVVLSVPINLRQFFDSATARNFFSTMNVSYNFGNSSTDFEEIIQSISESFKRGLTKKKLDQHLDRLMSLEKNPIARVIPLPLKDYSLRIASRLNNRGITSSISNVGRIIMPKEFEDYIRQFSVCVKARRPQITLCSYGDRMIVSFTSPFNETDLQRNFFQFLSKNGVEIEISSNL